MPDEPSAFADWVHDEEAAPARTPARAPARRISLPQLPMSRRRTIGTLIAAILAVFGTVAVEVAVAASSGGSSDPAPAGAAHLAPPTGQWIASGRPSAGDAAGATVVRSWVIGRACRRGTCRTELARQLAGGSKAQSDRTALVPLDTAGGTAYYTATFAPVRTSCVTQLADGSRTGEPASQADMFIVSWTPAKHTLTARSTASGACDGGAGTYSASYTWTASAVAAPRAPALAPSRSHTTTRSAFLRAALAVCTQADRAAEPATQRIRRDEAIGRTTVSGAVRARAEADLARLLPTLLPLATRPYARIPQPPAGRLDTLWLRDLALTRASLGPLARLLGTLATTARAAGRFYLTHDPLDAQRVEAQQLLLEDDLARIAAPARASNAIERRLGLPTVCVDPPAFRGLFGSPAASTTTT